MSGLPETWLTSLLRSLTKVRLSDEGAGPGAVKVALLNAREAAYAVNIRLP